MAVLKEDGKTPDWREQLIIETNCGRRSSMNCVRRGVGRGSRGQVLTVVFRRISFTSSTDTERKEFHSVPVKG